MDIKSFHSSGKGELLSMEMYVEKEMQKELEIFERHMARYQNMPPAERKSHARQSLIRSGVLNEDGTVKSAIIVR